MKTYVRVGGQWKYLFRTVDKHGELIDFVLLDRRETGAAYRFLGKALKTMRLATALDHYRQAWLLSQSHPSAAA
jgi:transposase-like protein